MEDENKSAEVPLVTRIWGPGKFLGPAIILLASAFATAPILLHGTYCGDDFEFHAISWFEVQRSWLHGTLYPHWLPGANYAAGEPRFIFYPPLISMLGAALGLVLPWQFVPIALVFLLLAATGLATRALALQALPDAAATLAGCAALFSGFTLFTAYERTAFAELSGGFWIPLLLLFALRVPSVSTESQNRVPLVPRTWGPGSEAESSTELTRPLFRRAFDGSAVPLALLVAGCWLSDGPVGIMASYLLAAVALAAALLARSWAPILRATIAAGLGIALAAVYLIPAAWEQHWVDLRAAIDYPVFNIEHNWLFAHSTDTSLAPFGTVLQRASMLAVSMIAIALIGAAILLFRVRYSTRHRQATDDQAQKARSQHLARNWWLALALIPAGVLILQFPVSLPVWNLLPELRFLQYPWRWVLAVEAPMAIFFAAAIWPAGPARSWRYRAVANICALTFVLITALAAKSFLRVCNEGDSMTDLLALYHSSGGFEGTDEYEPAGADHWLIPTGLPDACFSTSFNTTLGVAASPGDTPAWRADQASCEASATARLRQPEHMRIAAMAPHAGYVILRLPSYPAWRITVNGQLSGKLPTRDDGLIAIPVPQGPVEVAVDWTTTGDVIAGRCVSCLAALLLAALWWLERKLSRQRKLSRAPLS